MLTARRRVAKVQVACVAVLVLAAGFSCGGKVDSKESDPPDNADLYDVCTGACQRACEETARLEALVQAGERLVEIAPMMKARLAAACASVAGVEPLGDVGALCDRANTAVADLLSAGGNLAINTSPALCAVDVSAQLACEARCYRDSGCTCTAASIEERCQSGGLFGECAGTCLGECVGTFDDSGVCSGTCMGSCSEAIAEPRCGAELLPPSCACDGASACVTTCGHLGSLLARCTPPEVQVIGDVDPAFVETLSRAVPDMLEISAQLELVFVPAFDISTELAMFGGSLSEPCLDAGGRRVTDLVAPAEDARACIMSAQSAFNVTAPAF